MSSNLKLMLKLKKSQNKKSIKFINFISFTRYQILKQTLGIDLINKQQMTTPSEQPATSKQLDFYYRARKQYQAGAKPFTYEFNLLSTQPKPKKFMIILNKFTEILKEGLKEQYSIQQQVKENYWTEIQKYYGDTQYEMSYIIENSYQKKRNKLRLYFGLLLHNKKMFQTIRQITQKLSFMYVDPIEKINDLDKLFQPVDFLKNGQYTIMSEFVNQYQKYQQKKKEQQKLRLRLAQKQRKKQQQIEQAKRVKQQQQRIEKQQKQREQRQKKQKQRIQKERKLKQKQNANEKKQTQNLNLDDAQMEFIPLNYRRQYEHDKNTQLGKRRTQHKQTVDQLPNWCQTKNKQKNSQILYEQKYKDEFQVFAFRIKPEFGDFEQKKEKCAECNVLLKQGFYFIGGNQNQCTYTGQWYCNQHIADERIPIPWKALQSFDLRGYPVSRKSYVQIKSYYQKPILQIKNQLPVVKQSRILYEFLVLKRQIHLMYDSICDLQLMEPLLKKKLNYCLKQNLFSLKNLYDIFNGHEGPNLQRQYDILSKHFYRCDQCQKRKGYICQKCKDPVKIFAFQLKQTHGCALCRKLYHRLCLPKGRCQCQQED